MSLLNLNWSQTAIKGQNMNLKSSLLSMSQNDAHSGSDTVAHKHVCKLKKCINVIALDNNIWYRNQVQLF